MVFRVDTFWSSLAIKQAWQSIWANPVESHGFNGSYPEFPD